MVPCLCYKLQPLRFPDGTLAPGQVVVELTSGNTGTGLAIVCAAFGHPFVAVMSRGNSSERAAFGGNQTHYASFVPRTPCLFPERPETLLRFPAVAAHDASFGRRGGACRSVQRFNT